jgi:HEPN domain-containing protein
LPLDSNPDSRVYYLAAAQRFEDAEILLANRRTNGSIYLAGIAAECILKSLILVNSTPRERPKLRERLKKEYGHDLEALRREAARRGMHMQRQVVEEFRRLNTWDNNIRYSAGIQSTEDAEVLLRAAEAVIRWAQRAARKSGE